MASSRSTATIGAMITRVTRKTFATRTAKVWPGSQGGRGERMSGVYSQDFSSHSKPGNAPRNAFAEQRISLVATMPLRLGDSPGCRLQKGSAHPVTEDSSGQHLARVCCMLSTSHASFSCGGNYYDPRFTDEQTEAHRTSAECQTGGPEGSALTIKS